MVVVAVAAVESLSAVEAEIGSDIVEFEYEIVVAVVVAAAVAVFVEFGAEYAAELVVVFEGLFVELLFAVVVVEDDDEFVVELAGFELFVEFEAALGVDAAAAVVECVVAAVAVAVVIGRRSSPNGFGSTGAA